MQREEAWGGESVAGQQVARGSLTNEKSDRLSCCCDVFPVRPDRDCRHDHPCQRELDGRDCADLAEKIQPANDPSNRTTVLFRHEVGGSRVQLGAKESVRRCGTPEGNVELHRS